MKKQSFALHFIIIILQILAKNSNQYRVIIRLKNCGEYDEGAVWSLTMSGPGQLFGGKCPKLKQTE